MNSPDRKHYVMQTLPDGRKVDLYKEINGGSRIQYVLEVERSGITGRLKFSGRENTVDGISFDGATLYVNGNPESVEYANFRRKFGGLYTILPDHKKKAFTIKTWLDKAGATSRKQSPIAEKEIIDSTGEPLVEENSNTINACRIGNGAWKSYEKSDKPSIRDFLEGGGYDRINSVMKKAGVGNEYMNDVLYWLFRNADARGCAGDANYLQKEMNNQIPPVESVKARMKGDPAGSFLYSGVFEFDGREIDWDVMFRDTGKPPAFEIGEGAKVGQRARTYLAWLADQAAATGKEVSATPDNYVISREIRNLFEGEKHE